MTPSIAPVRPGPREGSPIIRLSGLGPSLSLQINLSLQDVQIIFLFMNFSKTEKVTIYLNEEIDCF